MIFAFLPILCYGGGNRRTHSCKSNYHMITKTQNIKTVYIILCEYYFL